MSDVSVPSKELDIVKPVVKPTVNNKCSESSDSGDKGCVEKLVVSDSCSNIVRKVVMLVLSILIFMFSLSSLIMNQYSNNDNSSVLKEVLDVVEVIAQQYNVNQVQNN